MLPVPERMLNQRNAQLYQRLLALQAQVHEKRSAARMEASLADDTKARANEAARALTLLKKQHTDLGKSSAADRERVTAVTVEVERLSKSLTANAGQIREVTKQTDAMARTVDDARARLKAVEDEGQRLEDVVADWVRENRETERAEATAGIVMGKIAQALRHRLDKCNAISAHCRALQSEYDEERAAAAQFQSEVATLREQKDVGVVEVQNLQARMGELAEVCTALDEAIGAKGQIMQRLVNQTDAMRRSREEFRARSEQEAAAAATMERLAATTRATKDARAVKLRASERHCETIETDARDAERGASITAMHRDKLAAQVAHQQEEHAHAVERLAEIKKIHDAAAAAQRTLQSQRDGAKKAEVSAAALATSSTIQLNAAEQRFERSRARMHAALNKSREGAIETGHLNEMIERCQKRMRVTNTETSARATLDELGERVAAMQEQIDHAAAKLSYAKGLSTDDPEVQRRRAILKERIADLELELEAVEKERAERDRGVRGLAKRVSAETSAANFMQLDLQKIQGENAALENEARAFYKEIDELVRQRQGRASSAEGLWAKLNAAEQRLAAAADSTSEAAQLRFQMEREAATRLAQIEADKAALQQFLNAQENERHRTAMRLRETSDTLEILQARYNGVVHLLQLKLGTGSDEGVVDELSAEEMQAKMMMQRAEAREELQSKGDDLDGKICALEREILLLDRALGQARTHVMDLAPLAPPPELDAAWMVVERVDRERRELEQARKLEADIARLEGQMREHDARAAAVAEKHSATQQLVRAATEEHRVLAHEVRTLQRSKHLTLVEHNRARAVSKKLVVTSRAKVPLARPGSAVPRMPRAAALHQALAGM